MPHLVHGGLSIPLYADDTIIFVDHDLEKAHNNGVITMSNFRDYYIKFS